MSAEHADLETMERAARIASTAPDAAGRFTVIQWIGGPRPITITYTDDLVITAPDTDTVVALGGVVIRSAFGMALEAPHKPQQAQQAAEYVNATERAIAANVAQNPAVIPTIASRAGGTVVSVIAGDTDSIDETARVTPERDALSVIAVQDDAPAVSVPPVSTPPVDFEGSRGDSDTVKFDRPTRPPGLSKLRGDIWDWIERHADSELSVNIVRDGTGRARGTCAEVLAMWRDWQTDNRESA